MRIVGIIIRKMHRLLRTTFAKIIRKKHILRKQIKAMPFCGSYVCKKKYALYRSKCVSCFFRKVHSVVENEI